MIPIGITVYQSTKYYTEVDKNYHSRLQENNISMDYYGEGARIKNDYKGIKGNSYFFNIVTMEVCLLMVIFCVWKITGKNTQAVGADR